MAEHQLPKLDTGVRFPSPAQSTENRRLKPLYRPEISGFFVKRGLSILVCALVCDCHLASLC